MRKTPACHPCAEQQVLRVLDVALSHPDGPDLTPDERSALEEELLRKVRKHLPTMPEDTKPAELSFDAIKFVYEATGLDDPYSELKKKSNEDAMKYLPELREWIHKSEDPLETAAHLSVAGNIIDLGIQTEYNIEESIQMILDEGFAIDHLDRFAEDLAQKEAEGLHPEVLYICDNAGEIAFDRLFLEVLVERFPKTKFVAAVNGGPILNDALMEDAEMVGLDEVVAVIDSGCDSLGTVLSQVGEEFREAFYRADWVISKGQANYETLDGLSDKIVFLLKAKCDSIADHVGIAIYEGVFKQGDDRLKVSQELKEVAS
jgi:uncharacterized protein with ATP-grasp and redox domains